MPLHHDSINSSWFKFGIGTHQAHITHPESKKSGLSPNTIRRVWERSPTVPITTAYLAITVTLCSLNSATRRCWRQSPAPRMRTGWPQP